MRDDYCVSDFLSSVLQLKVVPARHNSCYGLSNMDDVEEAGALLLENLSDFKEELANSTKFAKKLSTGVDIFVNDSFSKSHKILASTVAVARFCYASLAGFHFEESLYQLKKAVKTNSEPFIAIVYLCSHILSYIGLLILMRFMLICNEFGDFCTYPLVTNYVALQCRLEEVTSMTKQQPYVF